MVVALALAPPLQAPGLLATTSPITHHHRAPPPPLLNPCVTQKRPPNPTQPNSHSPPLHPLLHAHPPDSYDYLDAIESCSSLRFGVQIHAHALKNAFSGSRAFLETKLLLMYSRCASFDRACHMFDKMPVRNMHSWAGLLSACVDHGHFEEAILLFLELLVEETCLEFFIFPLTLRACGGLLALELGRQVHGFAIKGEFISNIYVCNSLIDMYGKCGSLDAAMQLFNEMKEKDSVSWNSMIAASSLNGMVTEVYGFLKSMSLSGNLKPNVISWSAAIGGLSQNNYDEEALELLRQMQVSGVEPNAQTLSSVLPACARLKAVSIGKEIHGYIVRHNLMRNTFIVNALLDVYRRCHDMSSALKIFSSFSVRNLASVNTMIVGYCDIGYVEKAKELFDQMESHGVKRETISWNSLISGYVNNQQFASALEIFRQMQLEDDVSANSFTLGSALTACADMASLRRGKEIHSFAIVRGLHRNEFVGGALVEMYCRCQDLAAAKVVFDRTNERDVAAWNALISGFARSNYMQTALDLVSFMRMQGFEPNIYTWNGILAGCVENGYNTSAIELFSVMQIYGIVPDIYSMGIVLSACAKLTSIQWGKQAHAQLVKCSWDSDAHIGSSLVDMYAKCGSIRYAELAFHRTSRKNLVSYNSMLAGFAINGHCKETVALFHEILSIGLKPDSVTFLSVLSSCTHEGSIEEGFKYFNLMREFNIMPELKHYTCIIDLLSRAGCLDEAYKLVQTMPMKPDGVVLASMLSGCIIHKNVQLGELVANKLIESDEGNAGNYVMLANLYGTSGREHDFAKVRQIVKVGGMHKIPGCSWIEDQNHFHVFVAGDKSHRQTGEIYTTVEALNLHMKESYHR